MKPIVFTCHETNTSWRMTFGICKSLMNRMKRENLFLLHSQQQNKRSANKSFAFWQLQISKNSPTLKKGLEYFFLFQNTDLCGTGNQLCAFAFRCIQCFCSVDCWSKCEAHFPPHLTIIFHFQRDPYVGSAS